MKSRFKVCLAGAFVMLIGIASAGVIVPGLDDGTALAQYSAARNGTLSDIGDITSGELTLAARFNPDASQAAAGPVIVIEVGGTSNGTGLYLANGNLIFCAKANNGRYSLPTSLSDTDFAGDGTGKAMAVDLGAVSFGAENAVYVSMDLNNGLLFASVNGATSAYAIANADGGENLDGNHTISFLGIDTLEDPIVYGHMGGLLEGDDALAQYPQLFWENTIAMVQADGYDNQLGQVFSTYVPEPATLCLLGLGAIVLRRRK